MKKKEIDQCSRCSSERLIYDLVDIIGDGKEEHFGKTAVICADCGIVIGHID